jgi:hypothetical protein
MTDALTCSLRVTGTSPDVARVSVRQQQFDVGRPIEFDAASPRIAALEYVAGAVAGELVTGLSAFAARRRIEIDHVEALIRCDVEHALVYLEVIGERGQPRIARMQVKVFVSAVDEPAVRQVWTELVDRLPLLGTLRAAFPLDLELMMTV